MKEEFDIIIIGAGPAGEAAAMNSKKKGLLVAVVDDLDFVGGNCTHRGTIPSKSLRHTVKQVMQFNTNPLFRGIQRPNESSQSITLAKKS